MTFTEMLEVLIKRDQLEYMDFTNVQRTVSIAFEDTMLLGHHKFFIKICENGIINRLVFRI